VGKGGGSGVGGVEREGDVGGEHSRLGTRNRIVSGIGRAVKKGGR